jgi:pimeloyl-ACP methyl ester carboxylesterase
MMAARPSFCSVRPMPSVHSVATDDGRTLHVAEHGDPAGRPVIVHGGTPGGAEPLHRPWVEDARARGIRLIAYDRPGYGPSTPRPGRTVADAASDVAAIADALGIEQFATWGVSGGGPHALACAALLGERVTAAALLGSPAPFDADGLDWLAGQAEDNVVEHQTAARGADELRELLEPARRGLLAARPEEMRAGMGSILHPVDARIFDGEVSEYLLGATQHGLEHGVDGWVDDDRAFVTPWAFDPADVRVPVLLWHGTHDRFIPVSHAYWLAQRIPNVDANVSEDDAHVTITIQRIPEVHEWLTRQ